MLKEELLVPLKYRKILENGNKNVHRNGSRILTWVNFHNLTAVFIRQFLCHACIDILVLFKLKVILGTISLWLK